MLLAGGIFAAVQASFAASAQVVTTQLTTERLDAFQQFLRKLFVSLPADARVELKVRQVAAGDVVELLVWPVPAFLQFGASSGDGAAISAQPDGRGGFRILLAYFRADDTADERTERLVKATWLPLLPDVKQLRWRFAPDRNPVFSDKWNEESGRPAIAELTLAMKDGGEFTYQYWVPTLQRRSGGGGGESSAAPSPVTGGEPPEAPETPQEGGDEDQ